MKTKGYYLLLVVIATLLNACADTPSVKIDENEAYLRDFIKTIGVFDTNHTWSNATQAEVTIKPDCLISELKLYGVTDGNCYLVADMQDIAETVTVPFDVPFGTISVMLTADGRTYTAPINSYIDLANAQPATMPISRAIYGEPYQWLICLEDLGGTNDFDFNDAVISVTAVQEVRNDGTWTKLTVKPLAAGGTLPIYIKFDLNGSSCSGSISSENHRLYPEKENEGKSEIHKWIGNYSPSTMINTDAGVSVPINSIKSSTIELKGNEFTFADYSRVENGQIKGFAFEVVMPDGAIKTIANNPTREYIDPTSNQIDILGEQEYGGANVYTINHEALASLNIDDEIEVEYSIQDDADRRDIRIYLRTPSYKINDINQTNNPYRKLWVGPNQLLELNTKYISRGKLTPEMFNDLNGKLSVETVWCQIHRVSIIKTTSQSKADVQSRASAEEEYEYLSAPQMFMIHDMGANGSFAWPRERVCITDAYPGSASHPGFSDWAKLYNVANSQWHKATPDADLVVDRK